MTVVRTQTTARVLQMHFTIHAEQGLIMCRHGAINSTIVLGQCLMAHMHEGLAATSPHGKPIADIFKLKPMGRLGGNMWSLLRDVVDLPRPAKDMQFKTKTVADKAAQK